MMKTLGTVLALVLAVSVQFANSQSQYGVTSDYDGDERDCYFNYECAAVDGVDFGFLALKIILALIVISCIVSWICMFGVVIWLFVKKRN